MNYPAGNALFSKVPGTEFVDKFLPKNPRQPPFFAGV
jgi:hypothetical protein